MHLEGGVEYGFANWFFRFHIRVSREAAKGTKFSSSFANFASSRDSFKTLHANHHRLAFHGGQFRDLRQRRTHRCVGRVVNHQDHRHGFAGVAFGLDQLMFWLKLNANNRSLRYFTAFNDGDNTADKNKKIGNTGGIYSTNSWNYIDLAKTVYKAVNAGQGGDIAENDIEGLLDGQNNAFDCENYVLIADNNAPVKDLALLNKITKPIKVVLCGTGTNIRVDYLNIARKTGGSVHTIEDDITNLALMKEGEIFEFKGRQYEIKGGSFFDITVNKTSL